MAANQISKKWILMTGVSRGLGHALARMLRAEGFAVCALVRSGSAAACAEVSEHCLTWDCSLSWEKNDFSALEKFCSDHFIAGFVHAAGVLGPMDKTPEPSDSAAWNKWRTEYHAAVAVNYTGGNELVHAVLPHLKKFPTASGAMRPPFVMHLSSGAALKPYAGWNAYCSAKAAMLMEFKCLAAQHKPQELHVLSVAPGTVMTDMMRQVLSARPENFPAIEKFKELEKSGGLVSPDFAAQKICRWLTQNSAEELQRWHGELYDVRNG
ncbi:MAG: SDR family NAD(P)-dependent oxidoreductase [Proteobacteria bacterium]|nr:SDR family NAD(P)-dependent oxidoreductase [Pseudomonadota bacterium]